VTGPAARAEERFERGARNRNNFAQAHEFRRMKRSRSMRIRPTAEPEIIARDDYAQV